jgi:transposase
MGMDRIKTILRLYLSNGIRGSRLIAEAAQCSKTAVNETLGRARAAGITDWAQIEADDERALEIRLGLVVPTADDLKRLPDWTTIDGELRRPDHQVTLRLLWEEYREQNPDGCSYTTFWRHHQDWKKRQSLVMRQDHLAGEKVFVDFCDGLNLVDPKTGEIKKTHLFVGVLGASSFTFAYAVPSQKVPHWIECHLRMYEYFGGVSAITIPDNLKSAVTRPDRYEPVLNDTYKEMAEHYGTVIIPARVRKPRDKAKAENGVLIAQRWILARLRNRFFYTMKDMNDAIAELLEMMNNKTMRHRNQSRRQLWETIDRPALKPLPARRYELAEWKRVRLNIDYHIQFDDHLYSAPSSLAREELMVRATARTVEILHKGKRVASHARSYAKYKKTTVADHMPSSHRRYAEWTPTRMVEWAGQVGTEMAAYVEELLKRRRHPEQGFRSAMALINLSEKHGRERLIKAVQRATHLKLYSYTGVRNILDNHMEAAPLDLLLGAASSEDAKRSRQIDLLAAENIRGHGYYQ